MSEPGRGRIRIREAVADDAEVVSTLERVCLGADAWSPGLVAAGVGAELPTGLWLVAEVESAGGATVVVGYVAASLVPDLAELQRIAVAGSARRRGVAGALMSELTARARADGAESMLLEVRPDNAAALAFYAAEGFVEIDRRRRYYRDGADAIVLRRGLSPS